MTIQELSFSRGDKTWHRLRKRACEDLYWLNETVLGHAGIPMRLSTHYAMIRFAERKTGIPDIDNARVQKILVPREYGKSTLVTKGRTIQRILQNRNWAVGIGNETLLLAKYFLSEIKSVFESNELVQALFPEVVPTNFHDVMWAADQIKVARSMQFIDRKEPTVLAAGVDRSVTGVHMDEWILDDILSDEAAENALSGSYSEIEKIKRWMNRLEPLCNGPDTPITMVGTPWWDGDCYDYAGDLWGDDKDVRTYMWTLTLPDGEVQQHELTLEGELATFRLPVYKDGKLTFPEKWPERRVARVRRSDPQLFAANLMLEPAAEMVRDFKDGWLRFYQWENQKQIRYKNRNGETSFIFKDELDCVMSVDPALSETVKSDRTGIVVSGTPDGIHHLILEARAERLTPTDLMAKIVEFNNRYKPRRIYIESNAFQKVLSHLLAKKGLPIYESKPGTSKSKEMRIRALEPFFRQGYIYIHDTFFEFAREYARFPRGRHDDILDAMAYLTPEWSRIIATDKKIDEKRRRNENEQIERIRAWSERRPPRQDNRFDPNLDTAPSATGFGHLYRSPRRY